MSNSRRVVITGMGIVSPIGNDPATFWNSIQDKKSGVDHIQRIATENLPTSIGGEASEFTGAIEDYGELEKSQKKEIRKARKLMCREIEMGVAVAQKSLQHAGVGLGALDPDRSGVIYGCDYIMTEPREFTDAVVKCLDESKEFQYDKWGNKESGGLGEVTPLWLLKYLPNMPASHIAIYNDFRGPNNSITFREASANLAIAEAFCTITRNSADAIIAGATGTRIHPIRAIHTVIQEDVAKSADNPAAASRPFDLNRSGQVIGEGAGALLLEELESAKKRNADHIYAEIAGYGSSTVVSPDQKIDFEKAFSNAIHAALRSAGMSPDDIGHVNAHGLSEGNCDQAEAQAIHKIFDNGDRQIPVVAPKSYFGNLGAGSGVVELAASVMSLQDGKLFPTLNYENPDPNCPIHVVATEGVDAGDSCINLNVSPYGQASATIVKKYQA